jgi:hypothetical protein
MKQYIEMRLKELREELEPYILDMNSYSNEALIIRARTNELEKVLEQLKN